MKLPTLALPALLASLLTLPATAAVTVTTDPGSTWLGYMNVFNLPADGGAFQFGGPWGVPDLNSSFSVTTLTLSPNTIGDPDPYWYVGGGAPGNPGNKDMHASLYVEQTDTYSGQLLTFTANVLANTLVAPYTSVAFIKDFAPDYSSFNVSSVPLTNGVFSISLALDPAAGRHVQYGFETIGPNVWATDAAAKGNVQIAPVPEASSVALAGLGMLALVRRRR